MRVRTFQIGLVHLAEDSTFTELFETAAWYQDHHVKAGTYPLMATSHDHSEWSFYSPMPSTLGRSNFVTLYGGMPVGTYDPAKTEGQAGVYRNTIAYRAYELAGRLVHQSSNWYERHHLTVTVNPDAVTLTTTTFPTTLRVGDQEYPTVRLHHSLQVSVPADEFVTTRTY